MADDQEILVDDILNDEPEPASNPESRPQSVKQEPSRPASVRPQTGLRSRSQSRPSTGVTNSGSRPVTGSTR